MSRVLPAQRPRRLEGAVVIAYALLALPALFLLPAIEWPDIIQGTTARDALPLIGADLGIFRLGYGLLLLDALLFLPATYAVLRWLSRAPESSGLLRLARGFAIASAALRGLWWAVSLTLYPVLWERYQDPGTDAATRSAIDVIYLSVNDVFSTVQEDVGVNILGSLFTVFASVVLLRAGGRARWLGLAGIVGSALFMLSSAELLGITTGDLLPILAPTFTQVWFLVLGVLIWRGYRLAGDDTGPDVTDASPVEARR